MSSPLSGTTASFAVVQALWGTTLLIAPGSVLRLLGGANEDPMPKRIMQILGTRHVLQASAERVFGAPALRLGGWIDGLHALSGLGLACADARWRRAALADAVITGAFAAVGLIETSTGARAASG